MVKTLVDNSHKTLKHLKEDIVDKDEILNNVNEILILFKGNRYNEDSIKDFKKGYLDKIEKLEEALLNNMGVKDPKFLKTEFPKKIELFN